MVPTFLIVLISAPVVWNSKPTLPSSKCLFAGRLREDRHAAFLDETLDHVDGLLAFRTIEGDLGFVVAQHLAAGAEEEGGEHPVVTLPAEIHAVDAISERLDLAGERDDLIPGLRGLFGSPPAAFTRSAL